MGEDQSNEFSLAISSRTEWILIAVGALLLTLGLHFTSPSLWESMDYTFFYRPNFQFLHDAIWAGELPFWNPHIGLGRPFLADTQNAVFYPPMWLVVLGPNVALVLLAWMHHGLAFVGMRRLAEASGANRLPANIAAIAFVLGGPFVSRWASGQIMYCCAMAYMPWLFILARRTFERFDWRRIALTAAVLSLQFFCGHPQIFWVTGIGMGLYIIGRGLPQWANTGKAMGQLALASGWSLAIVACVLLPFTDLIAQGNRADSESFASFGKMPTAAFLSLFGTLKPLWEYNIFLGWWLVLPGFAGLTLIGNRECRAWLFVIVVSAVISLGDDTPMFAFNYHVLPGFAKMRFVARIAVLIPLGLSIAGALWFTHRSTRDLLRVGIPAGLAVALVFLLYEEPVNPWQFSRTVNLLAFGLPALLAALAFVNRNGSRQVLVLILVGSLLELGSEAWSNKTIYSMQNISGINPEHPGQYLLEGYLKKNHPRNPNEPMPRVVINSHAVPENYGMIYDYSSPDAYTSLFLKRPWDYLHGMAGITSPSLANTYLSYDVYKLGAFPWPALGQDVGFDGTNLVSHPAPAPRAYLSFAAEPAGSASRVLTLLTNGHDIYRSSLVESPLTLPTNGPPARPVEYERFTDNEILLSVDAEEAALLVLTEVWYPGWKAEINGKMIDAVPANYWMRAVPVPAGKSRVRLFYRELKFSIGVIISVIGLGLLILALRVRSGATKAASPASRDSSDASATSP